MRRFPTSRTGLWSCRAPPHAPCQVATAAQKDQQFVYLGPLDALAGGPGQPDIIDDLNHLGSWRSSRVIRSDVSS